jgi:hypothetical protein
MTLKQALEKLKSPGHEKVRWNYTSQFAPIWINEMVKRQQ